jgi:endonuclease G
MKYIKPFSKGENKMIKLIAAGVLTTSTILASSINGYLNKKDCDQVIDKKFFKICYSYEHKGALAVSYTLDGKLVHKGNIKKRPRFYPESKIPTKYRVKHSDYTRTGFDRGHLANDASFDWSIDSQKATYTMANISPQYPKLNRKTWIKAEKYEREIAVKLGKVEVINLVKYPTRPQKIGRAKLSVPSTYYKILFNDRKNFVKCFEYENIKNINVKADRLKEHEVDCRSLKI